MARKIATAADVRAFGAANGFDVKPGRLSSALVTAFHKSQKTHVYTPGVVPPVKVKVTTLAEGKDGRKRPRTVAMTIGEVREAAAAAGVPTGARGRVSQAVWTAAASGDWSAVKVSDES